MYIILKYFNNSNRNEILSVVIDNICERSSNEKNLIIISSIVSNAPASNVLFNKDIKRRNILNINSISNIE